MTEDELKEAMKLARICVNSAPNPYYSDEIRISRAVLHLAERLKRAEAVCEAAAHIPEFASPVHTHLRTNGFDDLAAAHKAWREGK